MRLLRHALRSLRQSPGFALAAVVSLALGIGANTALFSITAGVLLHPLPYTDPDRLVILWNRSPGLGITEDWFSTAQYFDIRNGQEAFSDVAIAIGAYATLTGRGEPERVGALRVSANLLPMLGAQPIRGRLFVAEDDTPGRTGSAVLSHGAWQRRFGGDPGVVGTTLVLNGDPYEIVGVLPAGFSLPREVLPTLGVVEDGDVFLPLPLAPSAADIRTAEDYNLIARLRPGVSVAAAQAQLDALTARLRRDHPEVYPPNGGLTFSAVPLLDQVVGDVRRPLFVLSGAVLLVLLIACANVANLQLSRAIARRRELAVRVALGAGRGTLARELLAESVLLACAGGAAGVLLAQVGVVWLKALRPDHLPRVDAVSVDGGVLLFTLVLSVAAGMLFGLAPIVGARGTDPIETLKSGGRGAAGGGSLWGRGHRLRRSLVMAELALAVMLVTGAGLLVTSVAALREVEPGFDAAGVLSFEVAMTGRRYPDGPSVARTYRELWPRLEALPGVRAAGGVTALPLSGFAAWGPITIEGHTPPPGEQFVNADQRTVGGRYFEAMRIPLRRGRLFTEHDTLESERVVIVDEKLAATYWPGEDPIGKRLKFGDLAEATPWERVVGVVGRVQQYGLDTDDRIAIYRPHGQRPARVLYVTVHSVADPSSLPPSPRPRRTAVALAEAGRAAVTSAVHGIDPDLPVHRVTTMPDRVERALAGRHFAMTALVLFASVALALAAVGTYSVIAYVVRQGTRDLGVRLALGATPAAVLGMVLRQGLVLAFAGIGLGIAGALLLGRVLEGLLYGVPPHDPTMLASSGLALLIVAAVACWLPARRAASIDAVECLRVEN
jgi:predicted permease